MPGPAAVGPFVASSRSRRSSSSHWCWVGRVGLGGRRERRRDRQPLPGGAALSAARRRRASRPLFLAALVRSDLLASTSLGHQTVSQMLQGRGRGRGVDWPYRRRGPCYSRSSGGRAWLCERSPAEAFVTRGLGGEEASGSCIRDPPLKDLPGSPKSSFLRHSCSVWELHRKTKPAAPPAS